MKSLLQIQKEVGVWGQANFGNNNSKIMPATLQLQSLAPLMGMAEEFGELCAAETVEDRLDAVGDILVYLCDYATRESLLLDEEGYPPIYNVPAITAIGASIGKLFHATLKRHQGIRGFDVYENYRQHVRSAIRLVICFSEAYLTNSGTSVEKVLNDTWEKVVSKRNWKKDPEKGGGHVHEPTAQEQQSTQFARKE